MDAEPRETVATVMVVADELDNLALLERTLGVQYEVQSFSSPQLALESLARRPVDLVIADHPMPQMTGIEFLGRASNEAPDAARILLTGFADLETAQEAVNRGRVSGLLRKPIDTTRLLGEIARCLDQTRLQRNNRRISSDLAQQNAELAEAKRPVALDLDARSRDLLLQADPALLKAKAGGRDAIACARTLAAVDRASEPAAPTAPASAISPQDRVTRLERRLARAKLARDQMEHLLEEKTRELYLALTRLREQQGLLVQTEKLSTLGRISAGIAHELNNALNIVYGNVEHLDGYVAVFSETLAHYRKAVSGNEALATRLGRLERAARLPSIERDLPKLLNEITTGVDRAATIVRDLGIFSRPHDSDSRRPTDLEQVMKTALTLAANQLKTRQVKHLRPTGSAVVYGDAAGLSQVFLNLLLNAAQATADGAAIGISYGSNAETVTVRISDSGCGIAPRQAGRLFEPFFTTRDPGAGTGLGLFLCMQIVQSHGGEIAFDSVVDEGTTFRVSLPAYARAAESGVPPQARVHEGV
ncbi:MAG: response regulator [Proteobacteria bacterium]|nr:response regulator [Pseudomonadota bacterium]